MPWVKGRVAHNKLNRIGRAYGKLTALKDEGCGRWLCRCSCGNTVSVLSTNLAGYAKRNRGCAYCAGREDITGERRGLLTAKNVEDGPVKGRHPLWTFSCDCGGQVQGTVREFRANWLRSCGCCDSAYGSWVAMLGRCNDPENVRYKIYGGRGIKVCQRWHSFDNFVADMGERPKRFNLSRKNAEGDYEPSNCFWEHVSKNCRDTKNNGDPTKPGLRKGAKSRRKP